MDAGVARPRLRIRLSAAGERSVLSGHPWVYEGSVQEQNRPGQCGELAVLYTRKTNRFMGIGLYDPGSMIRVRVLHTGEPQQIDKAWWEARLRAALQRREGLFDDLTDGYRLVNGESDAWPGLVLDRYGTCLVLKIYTAAWFPWLDEVVEAIGTCYNPAALVLRLSRNIQEVASRSLGRTDGQVLLGELQSNPVLFREDGLWFEADVLKGQKTGFFLDQRESRRFIGGHSAGKTVLNAFSFSGGFSLQAARGGATEVTDLDISAHALDSSRRNHKLNLHLPAIATCKRHWVQDDVFQWLQQTTKSYDIVILDPPSMARRETERSGAVQAYERLSRLGAEKLRPGGMLACFSCSAHVSEGEFFEATLRGAGKVRKVREIHRSGPAPDHPVTMEEAKYLKGLYLREGA